jgi:hypothetical protein
VDYQLSLHSQIGAAVTFLWPTMIGATAELFPPKRSMFGGIWVHFRARGGYRAVSISDARVHNV